MAEEAPTKTETPTSRADAIQEYYDAKTAKERAAVVTKHPFLKTVFSEANHQVS